MAKAKLRGRLLRMHYFALRSSQGPAGLSWSDPIESADSIDNFKQTPNELPPSNEVHWDSVPGLKGTGGAFVVLNCVPSSSSSSSNSSSGGNAWEAPTEFQSRNVNWWKAVEVVLAPRTAKSQIRLSLSGLNVVVELVDNK
ncbi:hypothetical protein PHYSODRAFT_340874 [Phytophthora sojae]|uniref:Uncharacterized protein n=1 Tax=Phytophthora sojae (strain P6497) TaxID=1094619 RepID=G5ABD1_PHYSP|nr:hypothetical protein PHYSODRAFT_340874 [Phytophthora sojae]EGZ06656.1 hypothetical protein PHYSODRAFT_340874 [Phytophthora sojae]|eukprot:XP_009537420.1 hypothetical protein PHYSODRAFT_340874 [Phytophthora sojae]